MRAFLERVQRFVEVHQVGIGALGVAALVAGLYVSFFGVPFKGPDGTRVLANFDTRTAVAGVYQLQSDKQLVPGAPVRVHGVEVGKVTASKVVSGGRETQLEMHVEGIEVHTDASARLAFRTLLGGNYQVQLDPGSSSAPTLGDRSISSAKTGDQVAFDDLFQPFDTGTRSDSRATFRGLDEGFGDPAATGRAIDRLGPSTEAIGKGMTPLLGQRDRDLSRLVSSGARVVRALDRDPASLERLVSGADRTLATTNARRQDLGAFLQRAPAALRATRRATATLDPTLDRVDPLVDRLRPGARELDPAARATRPALLETNRLLDRARPLLRNTGPTFASLRRAADSGVPLISALNPTIDRLNRSLLPFLNSTDPDRQLKIYEGIGPAFSAAASAGSNFDAEGHFFYFPNEPNARSLGPSPCSPDLSDLQKTRCDSLTDVLGRVLSGQGSTP